jgi:coenzyme Q-binding protein COQ10
VPNDTSDLASDTSRGPTLLTINLAFEFTNPLHRIASQAVLPKVADKMVQAFESRCLEVYGRASA